MVKEMKEEYGLTEIDQLLEGSELFESFTLNKFSLNVLKSLSRCFSFSFAGKVELTLQWIHLATTKKELDGALKSNFFTFLSKVWG